MAGHFIITLQIPESGVFLKNILTGKKTGRLFLLLIITHILGSFVYGYIPLILRDNIIFSLLFSQLIVIIPVACFFLFGKISWNEIGPFRKIKISTILMVILFTYLIMPLITTINIATLFFTDNTAMELSNSILEMPFIISFFMIAILAPLSEELIFRGVFYSGYKKNNIWVGAILSGIIFGFMHLNFNQMCYALVIGVLFAFLIEATGSIWSSVIAHIVINGHNVAAMYLSSALMKVLGNSGELMERFGIDVNGGYELSGDLTPENLTATLLFYGLVSLITSALAFGVYIWIAKHCKREEHIKKIMKTGIKNSGEKITLSFVAAAVLCFIFMLLYEFSA